jgi:hypothetical protein
MTTLAQLNRWRAVSHAKGLCWPVAAAISGDGGRSAS